MYEHPLVLIVLVRSVEDRFDVVVVNIAAKTIAVVKLRLAASIHLTDESMSLGAFTEKVGPIAVGAHAVLLAGLGNGSDIWLRGEIAVTLEDRAVASYTMYFGVEEEIEKQTTYFEELRRNVWPLELREGKKP